MLRKRFSGIGLILLIAVLSIPLILPYFNQGYFPTHDGEWAVVRLADMFRSLRDLQFPVRFSGALNFGYGYPLFNFAYPFPYYLGTLLYMLLGSFIASIKFMFAGSVLLSGIIMYLASVQLWKDRIAGLISAVIYMYLPYRMVDLYVRGSLGESLSFVLFPIIFYLSLRLFDSPFARVTVFFLAISIGTLVMTHNIMTILFLPLLSIFIGARIFSEKRFDVLQSFLLAIFLGAGVSAFFWFPALFEKGNVLLSQIPIADRSLYFVKLDELLIPSWGYAPPTEDSGFSYQLGIAQILVVLVTLFIVLKAFIITGFTLTPAKKNTLILLGIYAVYFLLMFSFTSFIWNSVPLLSEINYPWTILSQTGFLTALLAGFLSIEGRVARYLVFVLAVLAIIVTFPYARPESYLARDDNFYLTNEATTTSSKELMPLWVKEIPHEHFKEKVIDINGNADITDIEYNSRSLSFNYKSESDTVFEISTIYYPGWKAYLNGHEIPIKYDNPKGLMQVEAGQYRSRVYLAFTETFPRFAANLTSVISLLVLFFILLRPVLLFKSR